MMPDDDGVAAVGVEGVGPTPVGASVGPIPAGVEPGAGPTPAGVGLVGVLSGHIEVQSWQYEVQSMGT